jgi:phosphopantetheinyl transferase
MSLPCSYRHVAHSVLRRCWDGPRGVAWLSDCEREVYASWRDFRRRESWLFGRILAKQLILHEANVLPDAMRDIHPAEIQIHSRDSLNRATRPRVLSHGQLQAWSLSIAHSDQSVLVALSVAPRVSVGVDVTPVQALSDGFVDMWLTPWERQWLHNQRDQGKLSMASALWAVKEAFYKAVNVGEGFAPCRIEVCPRVCGGYGLRFAGAEPDGLWRVHLIEADKEIAVIVTVVKPSSGES